MVVILFDCASRELAILRLRSTIFVPISSVLNSDLTEFSTISLQNKLFGRCVNVHDDDAIIQQDSATLLR